MKTLTIPAKYPVMDADKMTRKEFEAELGKGIEDIREGRVRPAAEVFPDIRRRHSDFS